MARFFKFKILVEKHSTPDIQPNDLILLLTTFLDVLHKILILMSCTLRVECTVHSNVKIYQDTNGSTHSLSKFETQISFVLLFLQMCLSPSAKLK